MDDALLVRGFERLGDLPRDRQRFVERHRPAAAMRSASVLALDQFHHQRADAAGCLEPVDLRDVRVIQRRERLGLALRTAPAGPGRCANDSGRTLMRDVAIRASCRARDRPRPSRRRRAARGFVRAETRAGLPVAIGYGTGTRRFSSSNQFCTTIRFDAVPPAASVLATADDQEPSIGGDVVRPSAALSRRASRIRTTPADARRRASSRTAPATANICRPSRLPKNSSRPSRDQSGRRPPPVEICCRFPSSGYRST